MTHSVELLITYATCLCVALLFGFITQKMKLSPIVGYLLAGFIVGPYSPIIAVDSNTASQLAEIGVILLMFGVGLQFHLKDLLAVKNVAIYGALTQIAITTLMGILVFHGLGFSWGAGAVFGVAISVASTVVLLRVLQDNNAIHTSIGHTAIGWLVVEDLFTILVLVLLPIFYSNEPNSSILSVFTIASLKLVLLVIFTLVVGQKLLPVFLEYIAKTGTRDLFTLSILALALGIAVIASEFFGASMALGAFLAGMIVGQSDFSARAASEALPMRDAFAVLFFVSVGIMLNPATIFANFKLVLFTLFIVLIIKPLAAILVAILLKQPLKKALSVGVALAQIGEFSFILVALGISLSVLTDDVANAVIFVSIISITLNPILYKGIDPFIKWLSKCGYLKISKEKIEDEISLNDCNSVVLIGYGPVGKCAAPILLKNGTNVIVIEMNFETVKNIKAQNKKGLYALYGDAVKREILLRANIECASALVITAVTAPAFEIIEMARSINPNIKILVHTLYSSNEKKLLKSGADIVFSGEHEVAVSLSSYILKEIGVNDEDIKWSCDNIYNEE